MAYSRQRFKDRVEEKVGGALLEFYKAECAEANTFSRWVEHWRGEVSRLFGELQIVLIHEIKGFKDRGKALAEVLRYLREKDPVYRHLAEAAVRRDFKVKKLRQRVPADATERFAQLVQKAAAEVQVFPPEADREDSR
jgi:hypothetical protein